MVVVAPNATVDCCSWTGSQRVTLHRQKSIWQFCTDSLECGCTVASRWSNYSPLSIHSLRYWNHGYSVIISGTSLEPFCWLRKAFISMIGGYPRVRSICTLYYYNMSWLRTNMLVSELKLRRPGMDRYRLDYLLERKAKEGVKIYIIL